MTNSNAKQKEREIIMTKKSTFSVSKYNEHKILGCFVFRERCTNCFKPSNLSQMYISDDESCIVVDHKCEKCGTITSFQYTGGHVALFKEAQKNGSLDEELVRVENLFKTTKIKDEKYTFDS